MTDVTQPGRPLSSGVATIATEETQRLASIDALRGWAFLGVMTVHVASRIPNLPAKHLFLAGAYGVQLFFLLSALTLLASIARRKTCAETAEGTGASALRLSGRARREFFLRRFFRIAPMFWFGIVFYLCWKGLGSRYWAPEGIGVGQILSTIFFLHGWTLTSINSVVPGGWSIAVEMTFYVCLPFLVTRISTFRSACAYSLVAIVLATALTNLLGSWLPQHIASSHHYLIPHFLEYWFPAQLPVFLMGCALYCGLQEPRLARLFADVGRWRVIHWLSLLTLVVLTQISNAFVPVHILYSLPLALLVMCIITSPGQPYVNRFTRSLGVVSFSCYIVHFCVVDVVFAICHSWFSDWPGSYGDFARFILAWPAVLVLTFVAAHITYRCIELPGMQLGKRLTKSSRPATANIL